MTKPGKNFSAPERTFERNRGCWSCTAFENGALARQHWATCRERDVAKLAAGAPIPRLGELENPIPDMRDARYDLIKLMDKGVPQGVIGMCMKGARPASLGGPEGDFVACTFLCDRWDAKQGSSVATSGKPLDKLNDELADIALDRANRKR